MSAVSRLVRPDFNLIPDERRMVSTAPGWLSTYLLCFLLVVLIGALMSRGYFQQRALAGDIDRQIDLMQEEVDEAFKLRDQLAAQQSEWEELTQLMAGRQKVLLVLKDLTERVPDDTYLQTLQIQGTRVTMQGYSDQASGLLPILLESPYLESVKSNWVTQAPRMAGKERFNFAATIKE
jgi:general secretion pathway protein L